MVNNVADVTRGQHQVLHGPGALVGKPHVTTTRSTHSAASPTSSSLNAELEMGATCTVGDGQCTSIINAMSDIDGRRRGRLLQDRRLRGTRQRRARRAHDDFALGQVGGDHGRRAPF